MKNPVIPVEASFQVLGTFIFLQAVHLFPMQTKWFANGLCNNIPVLPRLHIFVLNFVVGTISFLHIEDVLKLHVQIFTIL